MSKKTYKHFHSIEEGQFYTLEEADEEFEIWKKKLLASRLLVESLGQTVNVSITLLIHSAIFQAKRYPQQIRLLVSLSDFYTAYPECRRFFENIKKEDISLV
jgi:hypothetical protein